MKYGILTIAVVSAVMMLACAATNGESKTESVGVEAIDNETYKRAMTVSDYNRGRSVSDLNIKSWEYGHPKNLRMATPAVQYCTKPHTVENSSKFITDYPLLIGLLASLSTA